MKHKVWALPLSFCLFAFLTVQADTGRYRGCADLLIEGGSSRKISEELRIALSRSDAQIRYADIEYKRSLLNLLESVGAVGQVTRLIDSRWPGHSVAGHSYYVEDRALVIESRGGRRYTVELNRDSRTGAPGFQMQGRKRDPQAFVFHEGPTGLRPHDTARLLAFKKGAMNFEAVAVLLDVLASSSRHRLRDDVTYYRTAEQAVAELRRAFAETYLKALPVYHLGDKINLVAEMLPFGDRMIVGAERFAVSSVSRRQVKKQNLQGSWLRIDEPSGQAHWLSIPGPRDATHFISFDGRGKRLGSASISASGLIVTQTNWSAANASLIPSLLKIFYALGL